MILEKDNFIDGFKELGIETHKEEYVLDFTTLRKILSKKSNKLLDDYIEYIDCGCESYSLIDIVRQTDNYGNSEWHDLITSLNKDLQGYDVAMEDEEDLTDSGYDFLILFTQKEILEEHRKKYNLAVFGQESGVLNL